ncbi:MAG TPA: hypothetical protein VLP43_01270 [Solirubrobacteraceae bacterium]|nr:hypothetical protein [Solirubrobacteraceae bacterium]
MPLASPGPSELDARLAAIDRRLQEIQAGLAPDAQAAPAPDRATSGNEEPVAEGVPAGPAEPPERRPSPRQGPLAALLAGSRRRRSDPPTEEIAELVRMHNGLLDAVGQLVRLLGERAPGAALVSAGPFSDTRQVESFVLTLAALEPVHDAALVGYEGADRALIELQLTDPTG